MKYLSFIILFIGLSFSQMSSADPSDFSTGPVFPNHGENALIKNGLANPAQQTFKVAFDVYKENEGNGPLRGFNTVARFINMHVRAGVALENIDVAIVVHGKASYELMQTEAFSQRFNKANNSAKLLQQMIEKGVAIYLCGQSASYHGISANQLQKGVELSLSAMTTHALLQQKGYSLNPF